MSSRKRFSSALAIVGLLAASAAADVCVWRDPDRAMSRLFPAARDYETVDVKIGRDALARIEKRLGRALDPGERTNWIYYTITGSKGQVLGQVLTDAERGDFGAIELVMGVDPAGKATSIYVQRARERDKVFKSKGFLDQFVGKTVADSLRVGEDIQGARSTATEQVAFGIRKMLVMYEELKGVRDDAAQGDR